MLKTSWTAISVLLLLAACQKPAPQAEVAPAPAAPAQAAGADLAPAQAQPLEKSRQEFVATFAEVECAQARIQDSGARETTRADILKKRGYGADEYLGDLKKFGTLEAEQEKAKCMPPKPKTAEEFARAYASLQCALAREPDEGRHDAMRVAILQQLGYTYEAFTADEEKFGTEAAEAARAQCMPVPKGSTAGGLLELSLKLECAGRAKMTADQQAEYTAILLDEYGLDEAGYKAARDKVAKDADFLKGFTEGLKACPAAEEEKEVLTSRSVMEGTWNGQLRGRGANGSFSFTVQRRAVQKAEATVNDLTFPRFTDRRLAGNSLRLEFKDARGHLVLTGRLSAQTGSGNFQGEVGGARVSGHWSAMYR
jgi:hypothetical protein